MDVQNYMGLSATSRRLHGRRGLKLLDRIIYLLSPGRRLHGRRGLKSDYEVSNLGHFRVAAFTGGVD